MLSTIWGAEEVIAHYPPLLYSGHYYLVGPRVKAPVSYRYRI